MRNNEFMLALNALCAERDLSKDVVFDAIESALQAAYRRDFEHDPNVTVVMDRKTGAASVYVEKKVVEYVQSRRSEISIEDARRIYGSETNIDDIVREEQTPRNFGRIAAQTAKQVILQRIREAERDRLYHDYASREGELVMGVVQSIDHKTRAVRLGLGKAEAALPRSEQLPGERYRIGQRLRAYVAEVNRAHRGPQITVSRTHRQMLRRLLELEVPEITNGTVELRSIAREAGARSKIAVAALQPGIDPVGACVGMKGIRIQNIVNELNGEKIDVVQWNPDEVVYVANSLSPAKVVDVFLDEDHEEGKTAIVVVPDKQLSLAIGKEGQNARLAAKLTGWRIDIKSSSEASEEQVRLANRKANRSQHKSRREQEEDARLAAARALLAEAESVDSLFDDDDDEFGSMTEVDEMAFGSDLFDDGDDLALEEEEDDLVLAEEEDDLVLAEEEDDLVLAEEEEDLVLAEEEEPVLLEEEEELVLAEEEDPVLLEEEEPLVLAEEEEEILLSEEEELLLLEEEEALLLADQENDSKAKATTTSDSVPAVTTHQKPSSTASHTRDRHAAPEPQVKKESHKKKEKEAEAKAKPDGSMIFYTFNDRGEAESLDYLVDRKKQGHKKKKKKKKKQRNNRRF